MDRGSKGAEAKRITIHDLRHSHISLLIDAGFTAVDIANRVGHESIRITYHYSHMFPSKQIAMAERLNFERMKSEGMNDEPKDTRKKESLEKLKCWISNVSRGGKRTE